MAAQRIDKDLAPSFQKTWKPPHDQRLAPDGLLEQLVTPEKRAVAAALVTEGVTVSLASDAQDYESVDVPCPIQWSMTRATRTGASDEVAYPCIHGPGTTHLDAFAHVFLMGKCGTDTTSKN